MDKTADAETTFGKWFIAHAKVSDLVAQAKEKGSFDVNALAQKEFTFLHAPKDHFYADPMCIKRDGKYWVFFEWFDYNRGKLAYYSLDKDLNPSSIDFLDIDIETHTSFPFMIEDNGILYMIPERCHKNQIDLYVCASFPKKWILKTTIMPNVHAGDTTIIKHNGMYYMFTMIYSNRINHFCIFYSDTIDGRWQAHPMANEKSPPTYSHLTRGAGNPFLINDTWYRPAQYSNRGINGEGVILYRIDELSPTRFFETATAVTSSSVFPFVRATHTFSLFDDVLCIDGRVAIPRDPTYTDITIEMAKVPLDILCCKVNHDLLKQAFSMNTSGNGKCYYGATIDGQHYAGERLWDERWLYIKDSYDFKGKNVLELGCNMGILLTYLKKLRNINKAVGVDAKDDFLVSTNKADTVRAGKLLNEAFGTDVSLLQIDFNADPYEEMIGTDFDMVTAMSLLKWIDDKERFLKYLSNFKSVLYEGHEPDEVEIARFAKLGFSHRILGKTQTGASYSPDDMRTLILFSK